MTRSLFLYFNILGYFKLISNEILILLLLRSLAPFIYFIELTVLWPKFLKYNHSDRGYWILCCHKNLRMFRSERKYFNDTYNCEVSSHPVTGGDHSKRCGNGKYINWFPKSEMHCLLKRWKLNKRTWQKLFGREMELSLKRIQVNTPLVSTLRSAYNPKAQVAFSFITIICLCVQTKLTELGF